MLVYEIHAKTMIEQYGSHPHDIDRIVNSACHKALEKIKAILEQDHLDDAECFQRIEVIVRVYEEMRSDGRIRHDFG